MGKWRKHLENHGKMMVKWWKHLENHGESGSLLAVVSPFFRKIKEEIYNKQTKWNYGFMARRACLGAIQVSWASYWKAPVEPSRNWYILVLMQNNKKHGRYCCELYFSIYFHLWRTKKSDQCMDAPGAECWALGPWPINLGSLGSLQPWEHHEYLRPGTPGIGRNHPECWKARIYRPFCVWYVETDKSRKKLRCSDSLTLGFIDYPV
jgi:hypothetical protein